MRYNLVYNDIIKAWSGACTDSCTGFLLYCIAVAVFATVMIYKIAPVHGKKNPLIFLTICSTVGSVSVMSVKAFGIALKLTFAGSNQFSHPSTYVFMIISLVCILTQMNYLNKALSQFSTQMYVRFLMINCQSADRVTALTPFTT